MKQISKMLAAAMTVTMFSGLSAMANADRIYYLVGVRHVYRIGTDMYFQADARKQIEEDYAGEVSADNNHYQYQISNGGDVNQESGQLQSALNDLAVERDNKLGSLYAQSDDVRNGHPGFNITVDGPYQVIGVDYHNNNNVQVFDNYVPYAPWSGYSVVGPNPYGWSYGVSYTPGLFLSTYNGWYGGWRGYGSPAFVGFYGAGGPMVVAGLSINIGFGGGGFYGAGYGGGMGFMFNAGLGGMYHAGPGYFSHDAFSGGYIGSIGDPRARAAGRIGFSVGASAVVSARAGGYATGIRSGSRSNFAAGARSVRSAPAPAVLEPDIHAPLAAPRPPQGQEASQEAQAVRHEQAGVVIPIACPAALEPEAEARRGLEAEHAETALPELPAVAAPLVTVGAHATWATVVVTPIAPPATAAVQTPHATQPETNHAAPVVVAGAVPAVKTKRKAVNEPRLHRWASESS